MQSQLVGMQSQITDHDTKEGAVAIAHATNSKTDKLPKGSAKIGMANLEVRYNTKDKKHMQEMQDKYEVAKMGKENPADFLNNMELLCIELKTDYNVNKSDEEFLNRLMTSCDMREYEMDKKLLERDQDDGTLTIQSFVSRLRSTFKEKFDKR